MKYYTKYPRMFYSMAYSIIDIGRPKVVMIIFVLLLMMTRIYAQQYNSLKSGSWPHLPLSEILNADGSIKATVTHGSYDVSGYRMVLGKDGAPRFSASDPNDKNWDPSFTLAGLGGFAYTMANSGDSVLFIGGHFSSVPNNVIANNIAMYNLNTGKWSALGTISIDNGVNGNVLSILVNGSNVYIGGDFNSAGGVAANSIVDYNMSTKTWIPLGAGSSNGINLFGEVYAMTYSNGSLYIGGYITNAGGDTVNNIARWDGSSWHPLGSGVDDVVNILVASGGYIYAGGYFHNAGNIAAHYIAKWDGTVWSHVGISDTDIVGYDVNSILPVGGTLYVGGSFSTVGGLTANGIAKWNGTSWSEVGTGFNGNVQALTFFKGNLFAAGEINYIGSLAANNIAVFDTSTNVWATVGEGTNNAIYALNSANGKLYTAGEFSAAGGIIENGIASWDGTSWSSFGSSTSNAPGGGVYAIAFSGSNIYVGGSFYTAGSVQANNIAVYNTTTHIWSSLGTGTKNGVQGEVNAIAISGNDIYVGGFIYQAGENGANHIAMWDGSKWNTLGTFPNDGVDNTIITLAVSGKVLYAGGYFTHAGGNPANFVAEWDGTAWKALGSGTNNVVRAIAIGTKEVYVGGTFSTAGGNPASYIASWNGTTWSALGSPTDGVDFYVNALAAYGDTVFVGGEFSDAGGNPADYIARWDTYQWSPLGAGVDSYVDALAIGEKNLFIGGSFSRGGSTTAHNITDWNIESGSFSSLGDGLNGVAIAVASNGNDTYVGGNFTTAGNKPSIFFAHYNPNGFTGIKNKPQAASTFRLSQNYPNPFNPSTTINYQLPMSSHITLRVYDILGREVTTLVNGYEEAGLHQAIFNASRLASGIYFYQLDDMSTKKIITKKMVLLK